MARTGFFHHLGSLLLFVAFFLLLLTSISSPSVHNLSLLRVRLYSENYYPDRYYRSHVTFGPFGYCILNAVDSTGIDQFDICSKSKVGYRPVRAMQELDYVNYRRLGSNYPDNLTKALVIHPIACALAFFAFTISIGAGFFGSLFSAYIASIAWVLTLIVMSIDFSLFGIVKNRVNEDGSGSHAIYGPCMWFVLAAFVCLFYGMTLVFFTCCSARLHGRGRGSKEAVVEEGEVEEEVEEERPSRVRGMFERLREML